MSRRLVAVLTVLLLPLPAARAAEPVPPSVDAVLAKLDDLFRAEASEGRVELTVTGPRLTRTLRLKVWSKGKDRSLIVIEAPAREAGTATLKVKENLWNYLPKVARTIRVPPSMMLSSWMGTDFTNDDLVKESSYRDDFNARLVGRSAAPAGWLLSLDARPDVVGRWARIELVVDDRSLPLVMRSFDRRNELARTMTFDDVRALGGRLIPTHLLLVPADVESQRTELRYLEMQFDLEVPDETFSLSRLERPR